jgi:hypothetical protein
MIRSNRLAMPILIGVPSNMHLFSGEQVTHEHTLFVSIVCGVLSSSVSDDAVRTLGVQCASHKVDPVPGILFSKEDNTSCHPP